MATYTKINLSPGGTEGDGNQIALGTGNTQIHDTGISSTVRDEVWLWATNIDSSSIEVNIAYGYVISAGHADADKIVVTVPPKSGLMLLVAGLPLRGSGTAARRITATAGTGAKVNVVGYVNRITD
tara:strand:- start:785 stop:1162 length:378 start_codon:yes stop_codon:yes gene_type:complete